MKYVVAACIVVLLANLYALWPSYAGFFLLITAIVLGVLPYLEQTLIARNPQASDDIKAATKYIRQALIGVALALCVICAIEIYLNFCQWMIGRSLGDRLPKESCPAEFQLLTLLMIFRGSKEAFGFGRIALAITGF